MASNSVIRDHHNLRRNLNLNDKYISNDGGDEGLKITDAGNTVVTGNLYIDDEGGEYISGDGTDLNIVSGNDLNLKVGTNDNIALFEGGTERANFYVNSGLVKLQASTTGTSLELETSGLRDITLDAGGGIILDSSTGAFEMHGAGATAKFADMYAGMILGYTRIQNDGTGSTDNILTINSSAMTVLQTSQGTDFSIQFIVPPSGNVEIQCSFWMSGSSKGAKFSLSTDPSYAELGITHTYDADQTVYIDETDHDITNISFAVTGLTAGTDTTYYLAGLASGSALYINHGRFRLAGTHYPPIILKAIALPATIVAGE